LKAAHFILAAVIATFSTADSARAAQACGDDTTGGVYGDATYGGGGTCTPTGGDEAGGGSPTTYDVVRSVRPEPIICAGTPDGLLEVLEYYDPSTGTLVDTVSRCIGAIVPGDPLPPAPSEVLQRAPLPLPEVHTSPANRGLVGFETWLWWGADTELEPLTVTVGEWSATVAPVLQDVEWDMGNGDVVTGDGAGSEAEPSARYAYERRCACTITLTATWGGTVTLSHPLLGAPIVQQAGAVPFTATLAYEVEEREAVVVG